MYGDFPPNVIEMAQRQLSQFGRIGATRIYKAPSLASSVSPLAQSTPQNIRFREPVTVIALYAQETSRASAASFAQTQVRVQIGGQEDLFTDGQVGVFASILSLVGGAQNWFPILRRGRPGVDWTVTYYNASESDTALPEFQLACIADADIGSG